MHERIKTILCLAAIALHTGCIKKSDPPFFEKYEVLMGTVFRIKVPRSENNLSLKSFQEISRKALDKVSQLENEMSEWKNNSPISLAAAFAGIEPVNVTPDVFHVLESALMVSEETGGVFDISFRPLGWVWNVKKRKIPPTYEEIKPALRFVNYKNIVLDKEKKTLFLKQKGMQIGLGGIAKGYAAKKAGEVLETAGIHNYIINAGGDLFVKGKKGKLPWTSGIKDPEGGHTLIAKFRIKKDGAVVTSGDYENFFIYEGKKYHHIIDPRTGYPARGMKSVTVFSENPTLADAYATPFFILGYEKSLQIVKRKKNLAFIMIDDGGRIKKSPNVADFIEFFQ